MNAPRSISARAAIVLAVVFAAGTARAEPMPMVLDAMGPLVDVTDNWTDYQPSESFCVTLDGFDGYTAFSGDAGPTCEGSDDLLVEIQTPELCDGCMRMFINYEAIPAENDMAAGLLYARGHVFFHLGGFNAYTADPLAHSPNIKNFTNDKFIAPYGSPQEQVATQFDTRSIAYVGSTSKHTHSEVQGPYYVGPTYRNTEGRLIRGAYVDVTIPGSSAGSPEADGIRYWVGYNAGEATCPDNVLFEGTYADGNYGYAACAAHPAISESVIDPFA
jgi:hypothetical protein